MKDEDADSRCSIQENEMIDDCLFDAIDELELERNGVTEAMPPPSLERRPPPTQSTLGAFVVQSESNVDQRSGLRLRTRSMTSKEVDRLADEHAFVPLARLHQSFQSASMYHGREVFTVAVLASRSLPKMAKGKAGAKFVVWKLVDLGDASLKAPLSLFLFGDAYATWWKEIEGSVLCIVDPRPMAGEDGGVVDANAALKVETADQLHVMGTALDFGTCSAVRRDGQPCSMFINTARANACHYHVASLQRPQQVALAKKKKVDLIDRATVSAQLAATAASQPVALGPAVGASDRLRALREQQLALRAKLDAPVTVRAHEATPLVPSVHKTAASTTAQMITLSGSILLDKSRGASQSISRMTVPLAFASSAATAASTAAQPAAGAGTQVLLPHLAKKALAQISAPVPTHLPTTTDAKKRSALLVEAARAKAATDRERAARAPVASEPAAAAAAVATSAASAAATFAVQTARLEQAAANLKRARSATTAATQLRGDRLPVESLRTAGARGAPLKLSDSVIRAAERLAKQRPTQNVGLPTFATATATSAPDDGEPPSLPLLSGEERDRLLKATSLHEATTSATTARQESLLDSLREREYAAEVSGSVREVTITAHHCATCNRTTTVPQTLCSSAGHNVSKIKDVRKRFFRCSRCHEPAISLNSLMPTMACVKCSGESFRAVSLAEFRGQTVVVQSLLPTMRLNHDTPDELLSGSARKRRWQDTDAAEREQAEERN
jgi:hypothetical protein